MLYLLSGEEYLKEQQINNIITNEKLSDVSKYELDAYNYKDVLEDASSFSLFNDKKCIIIYNALIFTSNKTMVPDEPFIKYLENPNPNTTLIFVVDNIDERKKITKLMRKIGIVKEFDTKSSSQDIVSSMLDNYKMDEDALAKFVELVPNDYYTIENEINKLKIYKDTDLNITLEDVLNITTNNVDVSLFKLMDAIIDNNKDISLKYYHDMLLYNMEPMQIIIALANKYRLMYQIKILKKQGYKDNEIASSLKQNPKYIYVLNNISNKYSTSYLLNELKNLANLDYEIKSGKIDASLGLELYIIKK